MIAADMEEIEQLALRDPFVHAAMTVYRTGMTDLLEAMMQCVIALSHARTHVLKELVDCKSGRPNVIYLEKP